MTRILLALLAMLTGLAATGTPVLAAVQAESTPAHAAQDGLADSGVATIQATSTRRDNRREALRVSTARPADVARSASTVHIGADRARE